jgi:hypothetical protein
MLTGGFNPGRPKSSALFIVVNDLNLVFDVLIRLLLRLLNFILVVVVDENLPKKAKKY